MYTGVKYGCHEDNQNGNFGKPSLQQFFWKIAHVANKQPCNNAKKTTKVLNKYISKGNDTVKHSTFLYSI